MPRRSRFRRWWPPLVLLLWSLAVALVRPVAPAFAAGPLAGRTIVLNPEEGGSNPGGIAGGIEEKTINLPTALDVGVLLSQAGASVVYTRTTDVTVSLAARAALANQVHADVFLTIAANTLSDTSFSGVMTFYGPPAGYGGGVTRTATLVSQSRELAQDVQTGVVQTTGEIDRGIHTANFYVRGHATMAAALIETGFMTNPPELQQLVSPPTRSASPRGSPAASRRSSWGLGACRHPVPRHRRLPARHPCPPGAGRRMWSGPATRSRAWLARLG
jgi:N-acetylmuramoyl-L-alanine amidase